MKSEPEVRIRLGGVLDVADADIIGNAASIDHLPVKDWGTSAGALWDDIKKQASNSTAPDAVKNQQQALKEDWSREKASDLRGKAHVVAGADGNPRIFKFSKTTASADQNASKECYLIHVGSPKKNHQDREQKVKDAYLDFLEKSNEIAKSDPKKKGQGVPYEVVIPPLGIGEYKVEKEVSAKAAAEAIFEFYKKHPNDARIKITVPLFCGDTFRKNGAPNQTQLKEGGDGGFGADTPDQGEDYNRIHAGGDYHFGALLKQELENQNQKVGDKSRQVKIDAPGVDIVKNQKAHEREQKVAQKTGSQKAKQKDERPLSKSDPSSNRKGQPKKESDENESKPKKRSLPSYPSNQASPMEVDFNQNKKDAKKSSKSSESSSSAKSSPSKKDSMTYRYDEERAVHRKYASKMTISAEIKKGMTFENFIKEEMKLVKGYAGQAERRVETGTMDDISEGNRARIYSGWSMAPASEDGGSYHMLRGGQVHLSITRQPGEGGTEKIVHRFHTKPISDNDIMMMVEQAKAVSQSTGTKNLLIQSGDPERALRLFYLASLSGLKPTFDARTQNMLLNHEDPKVALQAYTMMKAQGQKVVLPDAARQTVESQKDSRYGELLQKVEGKNVVKLMPLLKNREVKKMLKRFQDEVAVDEEQSRELKEAEEPESQEGFGIRMTRPKQN